MRRAHSSNMLQTSAQIFLCVLVVCFLGPKTPPVTEAADILMMHPIYSRSHELVFITIGEELARRGHNVTLVRYSGQSMMNTKLIRIVNLKIKPPKGAYVPHLKAEGTVDLPYNLLWSCSMMKALHLGIDAMIINEYFCTELMSKETLKIIFDGYNYQVAIVDLVLNECGLAVAHSKSLPVVAYWAFLQFGMETFYTSSSLAPAVVPALWTEYTDQMDFFQRVINTMYYIGELLFVEFIIENPMDSIIKKNLPQSPHAIELIKNISMYFINSDFTLDFPRLLSPNTIHVGCLQCRPSKPLPQDLEEFMQSSGQHGVIVFSLGATFSEGGLPTSVVNAVFETFGRIKQKIIMKMWRNETSVKLPANVKIVQWLPQQDILGHPKTRLMITHCGMHGVLEGIYHSVPMVGIPIFIDQADILVRMKHKGIAVGLSKHNLTSDNLEEAIKTVLNDKSYLRNVQKLSKIIRDVPQTPLEKAIHWIEYVIRNDGASHLKMANRNLHLAQYVLLDVICFLAVLLLCIGFVMKRLFCLLCCCCCSRSKSTQNHITMNNAKKQH